MDETTFRRIALGLAGAVEGAHMNHPDFRAHGRIFATLRGDQTHGMVVLTPGQQRRFLRDYPEAFQPESGAWGRQGCTRVRLAAVDEETLGEAMTLAWQNSAAKRGAPSRAQSATARPRRQANARGRGKRR
jgi:hypothetical protein